MLLTWTVKLAQPSPVYVTTSRRNWKDFDFELFVRQLEQSELCHPPQPTIGADGLAERFNIVIMDILDRLTPARTITVKERNHRPWLDEEVRVSRRSARHLEHKYMKDKKLDSRTAWRAALKSCCKLSNDKDSEYWQSKITSSGGNSRRLWRDIGSVLGDDVKGSQEFTAADYHDMIDAKVNDIRSSTSSADPPTYSANIISSMLTGFREVSMQEVVDAIAASLSKHCGSDPLPTWLLKKCSSVLAQYITTMLNSSLSAGCFPSVWKAAIVRPLLKKVGLDDTIPSNYRPVANLPFVSKLMELFYAS